MHVMTENVSANDWLDRFRSSSPFTPRTELDALLAEAPDPAHEDAQWLAGFLMGLDLAGGFAGVA